MSKPVGLGLGMPSTRHDTGSSPLPSPSPASSSHGLRSQIGSLLPRHALFQVRIHIDHLANVPLVSGQFGVRWKFKNVQSGSGLLSKMKTSSSSKSGEESNAKLRKAKWKGKGLDMSSLDDSSASVQHPGQHTPEGPQIEVTDSADESDNATSRPRRSSASSSSHIFASVITDSPPPSPGLTAVPPLSAAPTITKATFAHMSGGSQLQTESRGTTEWAKLQNYTVTWDCKVSVVVQMDVHRETNDLLPSELKLVVMQRVIHGDPDSPRHPRMGALYLNLAEYANAGAVTRRYLLRDSKTNATLKLAIELEHIAGTKHYIPPPLPRGEILAEVSGLLTNNGLLNTRLVRDLELYNRGTHQASYEDFSSSSSSSDPPSALSMPYATLDGHVDYDKLAVLNGLYTTEALIETLFNPVPTTTHTPSPFTYFDPVKAREREAVVVRDEDSGSADTSGDSSFSFAGGAGSGGGEGLPFERAVALVEHGQQSVGESAETALVAEDPQAGGE
ncbi:hypothetical protein EUX98_g5472 [Antrodiella citrinella]|uniref:C2 NT-type domain-containing protein n=1 Tax=Antrodiella citrinella TaxID=2447956 RepID=A0A4S4MTD4_9APHY|nr:hypothetical protein EUX98_g5472 [Antrodiella citrinella]